MTREIGFVNVKTISGYRKSNELFNWAKGASAQWVDTFFKENSFIYLCFFKSYFTSICIQNNWSNVSENHGKGG